VTIRTFSGTHVWDPSVLVDTDAGIEGNADEIVWDIEHGRCPRCEGPLLLTTNPREFPAGSRITQCRSIPICGRCGSDECYEQLDGALGVGWGLSSAGAWPIDAERIDERRARFMRQMRPAILAGDGHLITLITEDGAVPVVNPCNTGGWAQYGFPDEHGAGA
jgi:hypothetical protein